MRWRTAFIRMPYARELTVPLGVINDTFESAITWDRFEAFHTKPCAAATEEALKEATGRHRHRLDPVHPRLSGRAGALLHLQRHAATPAASSSSGGTIKTRASDALIAAGGTITHHHAVGRDHMPWYREQRPALFGKALAAAKAALDPAGILNPGVLVP